MNRVPAVVWHRTKISFISILFATLIVTVSPQSEWAQASAAISGTVVDASGGVVSGATISVKEP